MPSPTPEPADILQRIVRRIREEEAAKWAEFSAERFQPVERSKPRDIRAVLDRGFVLLAEIKKGSPSRGVIRADIDPASWAREYEKGGAGAVSVVTEKNFFLGDKEDLARVRNAVALPVLRKDFLIHPAQVYESFNLGADLILLIASLLTDRELVSLTKISRDLGMEALVEVYDDGEVERALAAGARLIGINNRNLRDFSVDERHALRLRERIPAGIRVIGESGIRSPAQVRTFREHGFAGVLVGEYLLRRENPAEAVGELLHG